jgi:hypothetical protein
MTCSKSLLDAVETGIQPRVCARTKKLNVSNNAASAKRVFRLMRFFYMLAIAQPQRALLALSLLHSLTPKKAKEKRKLVINAR